MQKTLLIALTMLVLFSCSQQQKSKSIADITSKMDASSGFVDLTLSITDKKENDSSFTYTAQGLYKSDTVGIQISLKKGLKAGIVNGEMANVFASKGISLQSIGTKSDKLLTTMTELYNIDSINTTMRNDKMIMTCANLNQTDIDYTSGEYKFKVFMETETDNPELFINFDFTNNQIQLNEKDQEYRKGVLLYLMAK